MRCAYMCFSVCVCATRDLFRTGSKYLYINRVDHFKLPINTAISIPKTKLRAHGNFYVELDWKLREYSKRLYEAME